MKYLRYFCFSAIVFPSVASCSATSESINDENDGAFTQVVMRDWQKPCPGAQSPHDVALSVLDNLPYSEVVNPVSAGWLDPQTLSPLANAGLAYPQLGLKVEHAPRDLLDALHLKSTWTDQPITLGFAGQDLCGFVVVAEEEQKAHFSIFSLDYWRRLLGQCWVTASAQASLNYVCNIYNAETNEGIQTLDSGNLDTEFVSRRGYYSCGEDSQEACNTAISNATLGAMSVCNTSRSTVVTACDQLGGTFLGDCKIASYAGDCEAYFR